LLILNLIEYKKCQGYRDRLFNNLTGNDKEGRKQKNSLRHKQGALFKTCQALIFAYDNYQQGLTLQEQRGKHSSAFFKGTHQVAQKVYPFTNQTFDELYVYFSQIDQDQPSPWVMPAIETADESHTTAFLVNHEDFESISTLDFTGERGRSYIKMLTLCSRLMGLNRAFPALDEDDDYFRQCPTTFD